MTDQLRDDELFLLVRCALPVIDSDTLSTSGSQARAVLDRVFASDRFAVLDKSGSRQATDDAVHRWRSPLVFAVPIGGVAAAVVATLLVVSLVSSPSTSQRRIVHPPAGVASRPHGVSVVRARLLAALDAAGADVVQVSVPSSSNDPEATTCTTTRWFAPFDVQIGGEFREHVESHGCSNSTGVSESAVDITVESATPYALPTPTSPPSQAPPGRVGVSVCGTGSFTGYNTTSATPTDTRWDSSSEVLRVPAPATPDLLRSELDAGSLTLIGDTIIDGKQTIELSVLVPPASEIGSTFSDTLWVDASTYLPVREVMEFQPKPIPVGAPPSPIRAPTGGEVVQDFTFLEPTPENLALLGFSIPSGLTQVPQGPALTVSSCSSPFGGGPMRANTETTVPGS